MFWLGWLTGVFGALAVLVGVALILLAASIIVGN